MAGCLKFKKVDYYDEVVTDDGTLIALIRDILPDENVMLYKLANVNFNDNDEGGEPQVEFDMSFFHYQILFSLGGKIGTTSYKLGKEGWLLENEDNDNIVPVTIKNIRTLQYKMPEIYNKLKSAIDEKQKAFRDNQEAIVKN